MRMFGTFLLALVALACGGDGPMGNGNGNDNPVATVGINNATPSTLDVGQTRGLSVTLRDAQNNVLSGRAVTWSVNPAQGVLSLSTTSGTSTTITAEAEGQATVTATSEGKTAQAQFTVEAPGPAPMQATVNLGASSFDPPAVTIANGGTVTWVNASGVAHNVRFSNPPQGVTNIDPFPTGQQHSRTFNTVGTFNYECTIHPGMNGSVAVVQ